MRLGPGTRPASRSPPTGTHLTTDKKKKEKTLEVRINLYTVMQART